MCVNVCTQANGTSTPGVDGVIVFHPAAHGNIELVITFTDDGTNARANPEQEGDVKVQTSGQLNGATYDVDVAFYSA